MARPPTDTLTEREAHIMSVLWDLGNATADQVRAALPGSPHDSSVRTLLRVLELKSYVGHDLVGRKYVYRPALPRPEAQRAAVRSLLGRLFNGSAEELAIHLIEDGQIGLSAWERIKRVHRDYRQLMRKAARAQPGPGDQRGGVIDPDAAAEVPSSRRRSRR